MSLMGPTGPTPLNRNNGQGPTGNIMRFTGGGYAYPEGGDYLAPLAPPVLAAPNIQNTLAFQYLIPRDGVTAATVDDVLGGNPMGPITLTPAMPSITPPHADQVSADETTGANGAFCSLNNFVASHPLMAAAGILGLWLMFSGRKGGA